MSLGEGCLWSPPLKFLWCLSLASHLDPFLTRQEVSNQDLHGQIPRAWSVYPQPIKLSPGIWSTMGTFCSGVSAQATITILQELSLSTEGMRTGFCLNLTWRNLEAEVAGHPLNVACTEA